MSKPTLMTKGKLVAPDGDPKTQATLNDWVPYEYIIDWFRTRLGQTGMANRLLVLKSETASGKSTLLPPELYKAFIHGKPEGTPGIICTQPRVLTAIQNVTEMLKHYSTVLRSGDTIGWSTKSNKLQLKSHGLLSATIGTLNQQLRTYTDEEIMAKYKYILIDETHERDLQTDMTIYMLKNLLLRQQHAPACPFVVLMSATFEPESFLKYFGVGLATNYIWCVGATAKITEMWDWNQGRTVNDYPRAAGEVVEKIVRENPDDDPLSADILIFMPGRKEFTDTQVWLDAANARLAKDGLSVFSPIQIDSVAVNTENLDYKKLMKIPIVEQVQTIDGKEHIPTRRVIISTNVAETGLTLENLKYVIDGGFNREIEYNPVLGIRGLITKPAPKSRIRQRRGRAGRKNPGVFYPLYPLHIHAALPTLQHPQILIEDVSVIYLDIIDIQLRTKVTRGDDNPTFRIEDIDMIDPPSPDATMRALEKLYALGFISPIAPKWDLDRPTAMANSPQPGYNLTPLGHIATAFSMISPESVRMILAGYAWGCSILDLCTIAIFLQIPQSQFQTERENTMNWKAIYKIGLPGFIQGTGTVYKLRLLFADDFIDGLILYNAIQTVVGGREMSQCYNTLTKWCLLNGVNMRTILEMSRMRDDLIEKMLFARMNVYASRGEALLSTEPHTFMNAIVRLKHCIYDGYRLNTISRIGNEWKTPTGITVVGPAIFTPMQIADAKNKEYGHLTGAMPTNVMYRELGLKYDRKTDIFNVVVDRISTMDSYISPDPDFLN